MTSAEFAKRIEEAKEPYSPDGWWSGLCPAHDDRNPSFGWKDGDKKVVTKCQVKCTRAQVLAALKLTEADMWLEEERVTAYDYVDEAGALLYQVVRTEGGGGKRFSQRRPDPLEPGKWIGNLKGVRRVLYRLNELRGKKVVVVCEGEKDCDRLVAAGLPATTNSGGAGKWTDDHADQLVAAGVESVVILPDNDEAGVRHGLQVVDSCSAVAISTVEVALKDRPAGGDVSDYLDANPVDDLFALYNSALYDLDTANGDPLVLFGALAKVEGREPPASLDEITVVKVNATPGARQPFPDDSDAAPSGRSEVPLTGDRYVDLGLMWDALLAGNDPPTTFRYGDALLKMRSDFSMVGMDLDRLHHRLITLVSWVRQTKNGPVPAKLDTALLKMMLVDDDVVLPRLRRVVRAPSFTAEGRLVQRPGFDAESGLYLVPDPALVVPAVSDSPSEEEVAAARGLLYELVVDFPFQNRETNADRAAAVALALLPFCRDLIGGATPLHVVEAAKAGTGKSLLVETLTTVAVGRGVPGMTEVEDEAEMRKRLTSVLLESPSHVLFENLNAMLKGGAISQAITGTEWKDRILGVSRMTPSLPIRCCWIAVANNPRFSPEVADRIVTCRLVSDLPRPRDRRPEEFKHELPRWAREERGRLVWSCLTLVQNWVARGRRAGDLTFGSFQDWAEVMSGVLEASGVPGLLANRPAMLDRSDPESDAQQAFVEMWYAAKQLNTVYASELYGLALSAACLAMDPRQKSRDSSIGNLLSDMEDQPFRMPGGPMVMVSRGKPPRDMGGSRWRLVEAGGPR